MVSTAGELNDVGRVGGAGHIRMVAKQPQHCQASVPHTEQEEGSNPSLTHHHTQHISLPPVSPSHLVLDPWDTHIVPATSFSKAEKFLPDWNIPEMPSRAKGYVCVSFTCITWLAGGCLLPRGAQPKVIGSTADNPSFLLLVIIHICLRPTYFHLPPFLT